MKRFAVTELILTGGSSPTEWEGWTSLNRQIYIRYRHGDLTIKLGPPGDNAPYVSEIKGETVLEKTIGEDWDKALTYRELVRKVPEIDWPEHEPARRLRPSHF
ncbi:MAG: hypothetical protein EOM26_01085 [Alphaproteobacteria bacterium]|nr:hypothetical protein [Alphaproteobacteria bacterium]